MQLKFPREISEGYEALRRARLKLPMMFRLWDDRPTRKRRCDKGTKRLTARKIELKQKLKGKE